MRRRFLLLAPLVTLASCAQPASAPPRNYVVFFTADSAYLGDDAKGVVQQAAAAMHVMPGLRAHVRGFAAPDTGSYAFNSSLAQTRTQGVIDQLVADGVPRLQIIAESRGPVPYDLMPTESRRVEIVLAP